MIKSLLTVSAALLVSVAAQAQCSDLFISEYVEGTGNNKALEIYNSSNNPINLGSYRLIRWSNGALTPADNEIQPLPANITLAPKATYVIAVNLTDPNGTGQSAPIDVALQAKADTLLSNGCGTEPGNIRSMCFNGDDAISLEKNVDGNWVKIDIFACIGEQPLNSAGTASPTAGWTIIPPYSSMPADYDSGVSGPYFLQYWSQDKTLIRKPSVENGVNTNPAPESFNASVQWDSLPANTFDSLGLHTCTCNLLGVNDAESASLSQVFPNPAGNVAYVRSALNVRRVALFNLTGALVREFEVEVPNKEIRLDVDALPEGTYLVKLGFEQGIERTKKLIVKH